MSDQATVTITQTDIPSRSKQAGPCWIRLGTSHGDATYAAARPRSIEAETGSVIRAEGVLKVRRVTRNEELRAAWDLIVTGNPDDTVTLTVTPYGQTVTAVVSGVKEA